MISIIYHLLKIAFLSSICSILVSLPCEFENIVYSVVTECVTMNLFHHLILLHCVLELLRLHH